MDIANLKKQAREYGVVGAGGAGFPAYAKMTDKACRSGAGVTDFHVSFLTEVFHGKLDRERAAKKAQKA